MAPRGDVTRNLFATWSSASVFMLWIVVLAILASAIFLTVPIGIMFLALIYFVPLVWKPYDRMDPVYGSLIPDTTPYKISSFVTMLKSGQRSHIFSLISMFGFGPPEDDMMKDVSRSFFYPPTRLAAYWSLGFAFCMSFLDHFIHPYLFPIWGEPVIPSFVAQILSTIGFFGAFQALNIAHRYYLGIGLMGADHVPAVLINKVNSGDSLDNDRPIRRAVIQGGVVTVAVTTITLVGAFLVSTTGTSVSWLWVGLFGVSLGVSGGAFSAFRILTEAYRKEFNHQIERRNRWNDIWEFKNNKIPFCEMEVQVPDTDPTKPGAPQPPEPMPTSPPNVWVATFAYPMSASYSDYSEDAEKIAAAIPNGEMLTIAPTTKKDPVTGQTIPGTASSDGFRVWWTDESISLNELLQNSHEIPPEKKEIAVRVHVLDKISSIRGINRCLMHSYSMMTTPESKVNILKVSVVPPSGVTEEAFTNNIPKLTQLLAVPWVRAKKAVDNNGRGIIELYIGDGAPNNPGIEFPKGAAASRYRNLLTSVDWEYVFKINKLTSPSGSPSMMLMKQVTDDSYKVIFDLVAGVSYADVLKRQNDLMTASGNGYIEIHQGISGRKTLTRKENRELERYLNAVNSKSQFTAVVSPGDPLDKLFLFGKYYDKLITGRERGVAKMAWSPGAKADGSLASFSFEKDFAHLLIAGSSGSGKSVLIYSMIIQLMANNHPDDCQIWIIDPKVGFSPFQYIDNVTRYVDSWTPDENFFENVRDLLSDAAIEMKRRNGIFRFAADPSNPIDKLAIARKIAIEQGPNPDGSPNELMQPFIVIVIDECAMLFAGASDKETKELQAEILYYASKLARESRSAGIHILFATQYPTNASLPSIIRQQAGRIGLSTMDAVASQVIIDQPGLEKLTIKGSGKIQEGKDFFDFRGFLMDFPPENESSMSDILNMLPKRKPDLKIDGARAVEMAGGKSADDGSPDSPYVELPPMEDSIFQDWDQGPAGRSMDMLTDSTKREQRGVSDAAVRKMKAITDKMAENMGEEELNNMLDEDRMEDFVAAYMQTFETMKKK